MTSGDRPQSFSADGEAHLHFVEVLLRGIPESLREAWMAARLPRTFALLALSQWWGDVGGGVVDRWLR